ncbi:MAG: M20/M25/M40 family metallo-hydrolase [Oscillospiraceae bacterium]|nr:M20/M25/M40 family metallo-hydrolase [Oscillospiraceae bacterium]
MTDNRAERYAQSLAALIRAETISVKGQTDRSKFYAFHGLLRQQFPNLFATAEYEDFNGSFLLRWRGKTQENPILLMNHHDVVEASGDWKYPPFSGTIADGKIWGRGTLDTKAGLWGMLQAAEELVSEGFVPNQDTYFLSACTEETDGSGGDAISQALEKRGIRFAMVLDEGGMILPEPIGGAKGVFAMVGLGEKGYTDLKFIARSTGGHASTPGKNTPLVRLGKFMAAVEKSDIFEAEIPEAIAQMFKKLSATMKQPLKFVLGHPGLFKPVLVKVIPSISSAAGAMLKTTLAFTQAKGSDGSNVLPQEAYVVGNMRFSHHQGREASIEAVKKLAAKFDIETEVLQLGFASPISDVNSDAFRLVERAVDSAYPGVITSPYLMTGASDSRFLSRVCDNCIRFAPFKISNEQMATVHGIDENIDVDTLAPGVDFYKFIIKEAGK